LRSHSYSLNLNSSEVFSLLEELKILTMIRITLECFLWFQTVQAFMVPELDLNQVSRHENFRGPSKRILQMNLGERIDSAIRKKYGATRSRRVLDSFDRLRKGVTFEQPWGEKSKQVAHSYMEGLTVKDYHNIEDFKWAQQLEENYLAIREELLENLKAPDELEAKGNNIWSAALTEDAKAYGPDWKTLVLQDRGTWDPVNSQIFPKTVQLLKEFNVPCCEAFFAKQSPDTGIKPHSDGCNFVLTSHLALVAPPQKSWIEVGGERAYWEDGKCLIFDTSLLHNTRNDGDIDRYVLMLRFWHPEMTKHERQAMQFIFDCLSDEDTLLQAEQEALAGGKKSKKRSKSKATGFSS